MDPREQGRRIDGTEVLLYVAVCAAACACLPLLAGFTGLRVPYAYGGDALLMGAAIKGIIDHGWYLLNASLGAPGVMDLRDFPGTDVAGFAGLKLLGWFTGEWATALNLFFLLGFPATALTGLWSLRSLGVGRAAAAVAALLYAFLPLHFQRGEPHLFLSAYCLVPVAARVSLWMMGDELPAFGRSAGRFRMDRRGAVALAVALLLGVSGVYYAFFACFFVLVAAAVRSTRRHDAAGLVPAGVFVAAVLGASALALGPSLAHRWSTGANEASVRRSPIEAELYGLKLDALLLPVADHRVRAMAAARESYLGMVTAVGPEWNNEASQSAGIGLIGGAGFLVLLAWLFVGKGRFTDRLRGDGREVMARLATLNLAGVLLATVGGAGAVVAVALPQIRAYNRVSVYLAFFSLAAVALLLDAARERLDRRWGRTAGGVLVLLVAGLGLLDQVPERDLAAAARIAARYERDGRFVAAVERVLGPGKAVFQLPYVPFPENPPVHRMTDYQHFRAYLHAKDTRFSYGAVKGRAAAGWQREVSALPFAQLAREVKRAGFDGVWIDRNGYADGGAAIVSEARQALAAEPLESERGDFVFFPLD